MNGQISITKGAELKEFSGSEFNVGSATQEDWMGVLTLFSSVFDF